jgi:hypothetical protein
MSSMQLAISSIQQEVHSINLRVEQTQLEIQKHHHPSNSDDEDDALMAEDDWFIYYYFFVLCFIDFETLLFLFWIQFLTLGLILLCLPLLY